MTTVFCPMLLLPYGIGLLFCPILLLYFAPWYYCVVPYVTTTLCHRAREPYLILNIQYTVYNWAHKLQSRSLYDYCVLPYVTTTLWYRALVLPYVTTVGWLRLVRSMKLQVSFAE